MRHRRWGGTVAAVLIGLAASLAALAPVGATDSYGEQQGHHGVNTFVNYHNASGLGPRIDPGAWVEVRCKVYDPYIQSVNPDGYWYRIASAPWSDAYYAPANTFMNGDPWDGPYQHNTDFGVPDCSSLVSPPPLDPKVSLAQGPPAPMGYRYAISLTGFPANTSVGVECFDSRNPGGFYSFSMSTDASGQASTASYCYSGDGPDHWAIAGGAESNHVTWGGSGPTAGRPSVAPTTTTQAPIVAPPSGGALTNWPAAPVSVLTHVAYNDVPLKTGRSFVPPSTVSDLTQQFASLMEACYAARWDNCYLLGKHYLDRTGTDAYIYMPDLLSQEAPLSAVEQYRLREKVAGCLAEAQAHGTCAFDTGWQTYGARGMHDWHFALGHFSVELKGDLWMGAPNGSAARQVQLRFRMFMWDRYDFEGDGEFAPFQLLVNAGRAAEFHVYGQTAEKDTLTTSDDFNPEGLVLQW